MDKDMGGGSVAVQGLQGRWLLSAQSGALIRNVVSGHSYAEHNCIQSGAGCEPGRGRGRGLGVGRLNTDLGHRNHRSIYTHIFALCNIDLYFHSLFFLSCHLCFRGPACKSPFSFAGHKWLHNCCCICKQFAHKSGALKGWLNCKMSGMGCGAGLKGSGGRKNGESCTPHVWVTFFIWHILWPI